MTIEQPSVDLPGIDQQQLIEDMLPQLQFIYPDAYDAVCTKILRLLSNYTTGTNQDLGKRWDENDILLITYGDSIVDNEHVPLRTLDNFINKYMQDCISDVHILPFFPFSSDDGFAVIDYRVVNPALGGWEDIRHIASKFKLMADLVINHVSRESLWFSDYVADSPPARDYFIEMDPHTDVSLVTRPRNTPLLAPVNTHRGMRYVWATFSEDQIDLNFANPDVLLEFIDILLFYLANGIQIIRLDAIAFLWKALGTPCIHLEQTHRVVKLLRSILDHIAPLTILITETNVPNEENLSYFGDGDEAHMVYQFTLPPLVLHAMNRGTSVHLSKWINELPQLPDDCTYLNFTASHDGIGVRALEGILPHNEVQNLIDSMQLYGGFVSMKANPDGEDTPYEINISLFDAMQGTGRGVDQWQVSRFICSQAIMLSLQGIPALYIHSLLATPNDLHGVKLSGRTRSINRKKWELAELETLLENEKTPNHEVYNTLRNLLRIRKTEPCFNPSNPQQAIDGGYALFMLLRTDKNSARQLLAIHNTTLAPQTISISNNPALAAITDWYDLISDTELKHGLSEVVLQPYQVMWLMTEQSGTSA
jgi:sucrose phosphorylase